MSVADPPEVWRAAGFTVESGGVARIGAVALRCTGRAHSTGITGWALLGATGGEDLDGLATTVAGEAPGGDAGTHPNGAVRIDHVVLLSPDLVRTTRAFEEWGFEVLRVRDVERDQPIRQVFFRAGEVLVELVGPRVTQEETAQGPTTFFGIAVTVADLDAAALLLGDSLGARKDAVQEGRRIATLRTGRLGVSTAVALMSPAPLRPGQ